MPGINYKWVGFLMIITALVGSCVDPYRPPEISAPNTYLVVDGFLNGAGVSNIRLTRTQNLTDGKKITVETKATVKVEGEKGGSQTFVDKGDGTYTLADGGLQFGQKYRLSIKTLAGRSYQSDYVIIKKTPKIDEVSWKIVQNDGVQFYVSAHDKRTVPNITVGSTKKPGNFIPVFTPGSTTRKKRLLPGWKTSTTAGGLENQPVFILAQRLN
jgi:hypothetical protein